MNSFITFAAESGRQLSWRTYATFVAAQALGLVASTSTLVRGGAHHAGLFRQAAGDRRGLPRQFLDAAFRRVPETGDCPVHRIRNPVRSTLR